MGADGRGQRRALVRRGGLYTVIEGCAIAAFPDGRQGEIGPRHVHYLLPVPHDSGVIGSARYVSLHLLGVDEYARSSSLAPTFTVW